MDFLTRVGHEKKCHVSKTTTKRSSNAKSIIEYTNKKRCSKMLKMFDYEHC